jgi:hypothetical protein
MDVITIFLYRDLNKEVYLKQPEGYNKDYSMVYRLYKSLYRLKQAPRV